MPRNGAPPQVRHRLIVAYFRAHRKLADATKSTTRSTLNGWVLYCESQGIDIRSATSDQVDDYLDSLEARKLSPVTVNVNRDRLCWFYAWAHEAGELDDGAKNPMLKVDRRDSWKPEQKHISDTEYAALMKACGRDNVGKRDAAILSLLRYQGLRRSEVLGLDLDSYNYGEDEDSATMKVGTASHRTKNKTQRSVPLHPDTVDRVETYLRKRGEEDGPLFLSINSEDGRLTPSGISQIIDKLRKRAGLRNIGVHEFRRAWAIGLKRLNVSDGAVMKAAGWEDPTMVMRYTRAASVELAHSEIRKAYAATDKRASRPRLRRVG